MTPIGPHLTAFLREYIPSQREMSLQTSDTYAYACLLYTSRVAPASLALTIHSQLWPNGNFPRCPDISTPTK